ncbi:hypothetical protein FRC03_002206 [Tulasnella sp. 419]|nr:hypothetical protein FRC03_002206 [Tulasnella sp. 419]
MSYVDSKILLENMEEGSSSVTEWVLEPDQISGPYQICLRPSSDSNTLLAIKPDMLGELEVRYLKSWRQELTEGAIVAQWELDGVEAKFLELLEHLH